MNQGAKSVKLPRRIWREGGQAFGKVIAKNQIFWAWNFGHTCFKRPNSDAKSLEQLWKINPTFFCWFLLKPCWIFSDFNWAWKSLPRFLTKIHHGLALGWHPIAVAGCLERISRAFGAELPPQDAVDREMFPRVYWPPLFAYQVWYNAWQEILLGSFEKVKRCVHHSLCFLQFVVKWSLRRTLCLEIGDPKIPLVSHWISAFQLEIFGDSWFGSTSPRRFIDGVSINSTTMSPLVPNF